MKKLLLFLLMAFAGHMASAQCNADFTYTVSPNGPIVQFFDLSSGDTLSGPLTYTWDFGDGGTDVTSFPVHTYANYGTYNVCLTIADFNGCTDSTCYTVNVVAPPPMINAWIMTDSMSMYPCTVPATGLFYYSVYCTGFAPNDTVFTAQFIWGDGTDSTFTFTGFNAGIQGTVTHLYQNPGTYNPQLIVTGSGGSISQSSTAMPLYVTATCGAVSGHVYNDANNDCIYNLGEELGNISVTIYDGTTLMGWALTDASGIYSFNVPTGITYTIYLNNNGGMYGQQTPSCPASGVITVSTVPSQNNDFAVTCPAGGDLTGSLTAWGIRPGFTTSVCVYAYNMYCVTPTGQIEITLDTLLTPLPDTAGIGYTINGQVVTLPISGSSLYWNFCIPVTVSLNAQIGDTVCITMNIVAPGDVNQGNNTETYCFPVRNSFDPNDKLANPTGESTMGYILPNTPLTYTIRFQNTGNDVAYNIYILDTLDSEQDINTLEIIASSFDQMTYSLLTGNILRFSFDNIMLADSFSNEPASHGYVTYRINQVSNVAHQSVINNSAAIYFDFNPPIFTNVVTHTIDYFLSVPANGTSVGEFTLYPNPASDRCTIRFNDHESKQVSITDAVGKVVFHTTASDMLIVNTSSFANGIYTVHVSNGSESVNSKLIIGLH